MLVHVIDKELVEAVGVELLEPVHVEYAYEAPHIAAQQTQHTRGDTQDHGNGRLQRHFLIKNDDKWHLMILAFLHLQALSYTESHLRHALHFTQRKGTKGARVAPLRGRDRGIERCHEP